MKGTIRASAHPLDELEVFIEHPKREKRIKPKINDIVTIHSDDTRTRCEPYQVIAIDDDGVCAVVQPLGKYSINWQSLAPIEIDILCLRPCEKRVKVDKLCKRCDTRQPFENFRPQIGKCRRCEADLQRGRYVSLRQRVNAELRKAAA